MCISGKAHIIEHDPDPFASGRWHARWIWAAPTEPPVPSRQPHTTDGREVVALRRSWEIGSLPASVPARVCASARYLLYVNGTEVSRGPTRSNPRDLHYDSIDLAPFLHHGHNVIAALAWRYGGPTAWWLPAPAFSGDLVAGAFVFEADHGDRWLTSDDTWQGVVLPGWTATTGHGVSGRGRELIDAADLPSGWATAGDLDWPAAVVRKAMTVGEPGRPEPPSYPGGPFSRRAASAPRPIEVALDAMPAVQGTAVRGTATPGPTTIVARAGRVVAGSVVVDFAAPAGAELVVRPAEFVDDEGNPAPSEHDASIALVGDGTRRRLETIDLYGLQAAEILVPDGAVVHGISVRERLHPVAGGTFACSDELLTTIWEVGRRTVSLCSHDAYIDCPTREQRAWTGDAVVHQMVDFTTNTDWSLARWYPTLAATPRPDGMLPMAVAGDAEHFDFTIIPDWALHWVHGVWNLYRYLGDADEIARLLPVVEGVVRWFERFVDAHGTPVDVVGWVIIDWSAIHTAGVSAALCGLWGRALREFAEMAEWLGDAGRARWARRTHDRLRVGFERLWDPAAERYVDSLVDGERRPMASQHGQAAAIVGDLAPVDRHRRLVDVITERDRLVHASFSKPDGPAVINSGLTPGLHLRTGQPAPWWNVERDVVAAQPFFRYVVHDALAEAGRADLIAGLCRDWAVALERCPTSWVETWYGGTISHGWSSTPTRDLVTGVLGVRPAEPGFGVVDIAPALGGLDWASGDVPTPAGLLKIRVDTDSVTLESPLPVRFDGRRLPAGRHHRPIRSDTASG